MNEHDMRAMIPPSERLADYDKPLDVTIENDALVIRIGIGVLAHAVTYSDWANPWNEEASDYIREFAIEDAHQFAKDVMHAMESEAEDGSSPLTRFIDKTSEDAVNDGSMGLHEDPEGEASGHHAQERSEKENALKLPSDPVAHRTTETRFIPHGSTCQADHDNGPDWGRCGEPARAIVHVEGYDRYVCGSHLARLPDRTTETVEDTDAVVAARIDLLDYLRQRGLLFPGMDERNNELHSLIDALIAAVRQEGHAELRIWEDATANQRERAEKAESLLSVCQEHRTTKEEEK